MGFFKPSTAQAASQFAARLEALAWILIYGGLLALVLGVWVRRADEATGWWLIAGGALVAVAGFALIYVRSRLNPPSS